MKVVNDRDHAIKFLLQKLRSLLQSFEADCETTYQDEAWLLFQLGEQRLDTYITWVQYYNANAPLLKWNPHNNYIELHYPNRNDFEITTIAEHAKLCAMMEKESRELTRRKAGYLLEMLNCARSLDELTISGSLKPLEPEVINLLYLEATIEKFHYLVYHLVPLYSDHMRLHRD